LSREKLNNRVALVTGAGTGLGRATALLFGREGARVAVNYAHSRDAAEDLVTQIRSDGGTAIAIQADVADDNQVRAMVARVEQEFGGLDYLVNNAGWSTVVPHVNLDSLTDEIWDRTLNTNLRGAFYCARAVVPFLKQRPGSAIVNIASVAAQTGFGSSIAYAASKGGMVTMTKSLARALAPDIRVNAVCPGAVHTRFANWPDTMFEQAAHVSPLQRIATVDEVASTVLFLCADALSITGEIVTIDSGLAQLGRTR
jgi:3-oxoacyl-[acyl-carrier protein] reductase